MLKKIKNLFNKKNEGNNEESEDDNHDFVNLESDEQTQLDNLVFSSSAAIDWDGMPLAPEIVKTSPNGAYVLFGPAINQANSWHSPTNEEKRLTSILLTSWKTSTEKGISKDTTKAILDAADKLGLQVCRVKSTKILNGVQVLDSHLLVYTKKGVRNYSGSFFMLRETKHSKVFIIGPHDDSDGTYADTKIGMADTFALACISNGHHRSKVGFPKDKIRMSDFVHTPNNLGTYALQLICNMFPGTVCLHIHGMSNDKKCLLNCRDPAMANIFKKAIADNTKLDMTSFGNFRAGYPIDKMVNTNYYLKTEIPTIIHMNNKAIIRQVILSLEAQKWAWW